MRATTIFFILLIIVSEGICGIQVKGFVGGALLIKCKFEEKYKHDKKLFCKSGDKKCPFESQTVDSRYKEFNYKSEGLYVVFIKHLALTDAGDYSCVLGNDKNTEVTISIKEDSCCTQPLTVSSDVGGHVDIPCKYPRESKDNNKVFCRQGNVFTCNNLISEKPKPATSERFSVSDDMQQNTFTVHIRNVSSSKDADVYWCGVRTGSNTDSVALLTQVTLKVQDPERPSLSPAGVCLTLAVLILGIVISIYLKCRHNRTSSDLLTRKPRDKIQACSADGDIKDCDRPPPLPLTNPRSPVSNPRDEGRPVDLTDPSDPSGPTDPSDGPSYATVRFLRSHENTSTAAQQAEDSSCEYATVKHPS
ncbi:uncharacterized protein LOC134083380 isoform X2 [Sardina pilchardus]|uniref:uncharacterized protein LOC134083380 isoform X2 n=1 Tax=Sardina pilchardus TaxID=27697 RepID=UPI002E130584